MQMSEVFHNENICFGSLTSVLQCPQTPAILWPLYYTFLVASAIICLHALPLTQNLVSLLLTEVAPTD